VPLLKWLGDYMTVSELLELFDNWDIPVVINDNMLVCALRYTRIADFANSKHPLLKAEVVSFGFYNGELTIRVNQYI